MAYAQRHRIPMRQRSDVLGSALTTALISAGANALVPGSGAVVAAASGTGFLSRVFGGADAARQQRVRWTVQQAQMGSTLAAGIIMAAPYNVSGNEKKMWEEAVTLIPDDVLVRAKPYWPEGLPDFYTDTNGATHRQIVTEVAQAQMSGRSQIPAVTTGFGFPVSRSEVVEQRPGATLPVVTSTAPYNYVPWIIGGGAVGLALLLSRKRGR